MSSFTPYIPLEDPSYQEYKKRREAIIESWARARLPQVIDICYQEGPTFNMYETGMTEEQASAITNKQLQVISEQYLPESEPVVETVSQSESTYYGKANNLSAETDKVETINQASVSPSIDSQSQSQNYYPSVLDVTQIVDVDKDIQPIQDDSSQISQVVDQEVQKSKLPLGLLAIGAVIAAVVIK